MLAAYNAGQRDFGENKVQELLKKSEALSYLTDIRWHFIGHLQSNKVNQLLGVQNLYMVHTVDREKIARMLNHRLAESGRELKVLIQVNTSREESKYGCSPKQTEGLASFITGMPHLHLVGFMTIGKLGGTTREVGQCFSELKSVADQIKENFKEQLLRNSWGVQHLSMGMTSDYREAIEEGSTMIRIGQAIFGKRRTPDSEYWPE